MVKTFIFLIVAAFTKLCETTSDVGMKNTIQYFGGYYRSSCITLLYTEDQFLSKGGQIHWLVHQLALELDNIRVTAMSYHYFTQKYRKWKNMKCNSPLIVIVYSDDGTKEELEKVSRTRLFHMTFWLMFKDNAFHLQEFFKNIETPFDLRLIIAEAKTEDRVEFNEVYRVLNGRPLRAPSVGYWSKEDGFRMNPRVVYERRRDLEGIVLKTGSTDNYPMHYFETLPDGKTVLKGYFPEVWRELERILNFTSINYPSIDRVTGIPEEDGNWNGLVGMLQRREIDVAVSVFVMDEQRSHAIDFTRPLLRSSYQIFYKNLGNNFHWDAILRPFQREIWMTIIIWILLSAVFSWICNEFTHKYGIEKSSRKVDFNLINSGLFFTKALCNQGHYCTPSAIPSRIIFLTAYVVAGVLVPSYSAALIFFLTSRSPVRPFDSLSELLQLGTYRLQTISKTAHYTYFSNSTNPLLHKIYVELMKKIPEEDLPLTMTEAISKLCKERNLAHFGDMANSVTYVDAVNSKGGDCKIMHLRREISSIYSSMGLVRDSPYRLLFNHYLHKLVDTGIVDQIERETFPIKKSGPKYRTWGIIATNDVFQVFTILVTGMVLSIFVLIIEIVHMRIKNYQKWKSQKSSRVFHITRSIHLTAYTEHMTGDTPGPNFSDMTEMLSISSTLMLYCLLLQLRSSFCL